MRSHEHSTRLPHASQSSRFPQYAREVQDVNAYLTLLESIFDLLDFNLTESLDLLQHSLRGDMNGLEVQRD
jgi:hypothetical protein